MLISLIYYRQQKVQGGTHKWSLRFRLFPKSNALQNSTDSHLRISRCAPHSRSGDRICARLKFFLITNKDNLYNCLGTAVTVVTVTVVTVTVTTVTVVIVTVVTVTVTTVTVTTVNDSVALIDLGHSTIFFKTKE